MTDISALREAVTRIEDSVVWRTQAGGGGELIGALSVAVAHARETITSHDRNEELKREHEQAQLGQFVNARDTAEAWPLDVQCWRCRETMSSATQEVGSHAVVFECRKCGVRTALGTIGIDVSGWSFYGPFAIDTEQARHRLFMKDAALDTPLEECHNMDTRKVPPALTKEEWAAWDDILALCASKPEFAPSMPLRLRSVAENNDALPSDHPSKLTWAMVDDLEEAANEVTLLHNTTCPNGVQCHHFELTVRMFRQARALESLLRPR